MTEAIVVAIRHRLLRRDRHHPGGDGEHDGDDARASGSAEYATLKALGFGPGFVALLIFGESLGDRAHRRPRSASRSRSRSARWFAAQMGTLFPVFEVSTGTVALQAACAIVVGDRGGARAGRRAARVRIVDGLRAIG